MHFFSKFASTFNHQLEMVILCTQKTKFIRANFSDSIQIGLVELLRNLPVFWQVFLYKAFFNVDLRLAKTKKATGFTLWPVRAQRAAVTLRTNALQCCYAMWRSEAITDANTELEAPMMTGTMMLVTIHLRAF
ncbi:TPA: hypothetical protein P6244_003815 [Escherichia coli]|nr:hypothetical protein [Escherichia coli]